MTKTQKIIGSTVLSLFLLAITLFSMCSVRMQKLNTDGDIDDLAFEEDFAEGDEAYQEDLLSRLEVLEGDPAELQTDPGKEDIFSPMDAEGSTSSSDKLGSTQQNEAEAFLTPELLEEMKKEVNDLQEIYQAKERTADSLRQKIREKQFAEVSKAGAEQTQQFVERSLSSLEIPDTTPQTQPSSSYSGYPNSEVGQLYQDALADYNSRRFTSAIRKFRDILLRGDAGSLADNCQYWIGESYYALGRYLQAVVEFEKVHIYPKENKVTDAQLMIGLSFMKLGETQQARQELTVLPAFYSKAGAARKASRYLNSLGGA